MEMIVCIKQVPDTSEVKIDPETGTLLRQGIPTAINPFDKHAVEMALQLKEKHGGHVTVLTMGPPQAKEALQECMAMGGDNVILISDRAFGGADTLATSYTLAAAIRKIKTYDIVFFGRQSIDGETGQVGPETAEHLGISQVTYASSVEIEGRVATVNRECDEGYEVIQVELPVALSVVKTSEEPRYPTLKGTVKAHRMDIPIWSALDLSIDKDRIGIKGSATQVEKIFTPPMRTDCLFIRKDSVEAAVAELMELLSESKIV